MMKLLATLAVTSAAITGTSAAGTCDKTMMTLCDASQLATGSCVSEYGFCGTGAAFCNANSKWGQECMENYLRVEGLKMKKIAGTEAMVCQSSKQYKCEPEELLAGYCVSEFGFCGNTATFCNAKSLWTIHCITTVYEPTSIPTTSAVAITTGAAFTTAAATTTFLVTTGTTGAVTTGAVTTGPATTGTTGPVTTGTTGPVTTGTTGPATTGPVTGVAGGSTVATTATLKPTTVAPTATSTKVDLFAEKVVDIKAGSATVEDHHNWWILLGVGISVVVLAIGAGFVVIRRENATKAAAAANEARFREFAGAAEVIA